MKIKGKFNNAQKIEDSGFFIGLHTKKISEKLLILFQKACLKLMSYKYGSKAKY